MIDIQAVRNGYDKQEISDIGFVRTQNNPADGFTKTAKCEALNEILRTGKITHDVDQWIIRDSKAPQH